MYKKKPFRVCRCQTSSLRIMLQRITPRRLITHMLSGKGAICALALYIGGTCASSAADIVQPDAPPPVTTYGTVAFAGIDGRSQSYYGYVGVIHALNRDLSTDGFLLRALGIYNEYNYSSNAVVGGNVDGRMTAFDVVLGYQRYFQGFVGRAYVGVDYESHDLSPNNPFDYNRGTGVGVKVRGELETFYNSPFYASLLTSYGSAKDRYWARGRIGRSYRGVIFGPEFELTGNPESDEQRIGAFATFRDPALVPFELSVSGGYSNTDENWGGGSAYGTLEMSVAF